MSKNLLILACATIATAGIMAMETNVPYATAYETKITVDNKTDKQANILLGKGEEEVRGQVNPMSKRTFSSKGICFNDVEVSLGSATIVGKRGKEIPGNLCNEQTIQIIPDNSKKGFHFKVVRDRQEPPGGWFWNE